MASKVQIIGGHFQDAEGNPLANGLLVMELCADMQESTGPSQVVGGLVLKISLDNNGNIADTIKVWPNDALSPANGCYLVDVFSKDGTRAWKSPQYQKVLSSPSPFDISVWVPTPGGGCGCSANANNGILLQTNGVNNTSQTIENLKAGSGVTLTADAFGGTTIAANTGTSVALKTNGVSNTSQTIENLISGTGITLTADGAGGTTVAASNTNLIPGNLFAGTASNQRDQTLFVLIPGSALTPNANFKMILHVNNGGSSSNMIVGQMAILRTTIANAAVISSTPVTIGSSGTPTITVPGTSTQNTPQVITTDTISLALDNGHDYFFAIYFTDVLSNSLFGICNCPNSMLPTFFVGGNHVGDTTIPFIPAWGTGSPGRLVSRVVVP